MVADNDKVPGRVFLGWGKAEKMMMSKGTEQSQ
jgi:hypothetical protein